MPDRIPLPIPLGFYQHESVPLASQRCIGYIPTVAEAEALNNRALIQFPGIKTFASTSFGVCRGGRTFNGVPYFVVGEKLVSISRNGVVSAIGDIPGVSRVSMADNGSSLVIVIPNGDGYVYDGLTVSKITDPDYQKADTVEFYRGFFVFTASDGKQLFVSNLNAPLTFDALDFGSAEGDPDRIITQILDHDELSVLGERTTEVFKLRGGVGFPLRIIPGAYTEKGATAKYGIIKFDNSYAFVGGGSNERPSIWRQGSSSQAFKISTDAVDNEIQKFTDEEIANCYAMNISNKGQVLAIFSFTSNTIPGKTFVYNATASALAQRQVWFELQSGVNDRQWRVNTIVKAYGKFLCGDDTDGRIGELNTDTYDEYGDALFRQVSSSPFSQNGTDIFAGEFCVNFEAGLGLNDGQGDDPVAMYDYSDDGGRTWSFDTTRKIGKIGEYGHEAIWRRQGRFPNSRSVRVTVTDPIKANILRFEATPEVGSQ